MEGEETMPTKRLRKDTSLKAHQSYDESRRDEALASQGVDSVEDGKDGWVEGHSEHTCTRTNSKDVGEQHVSTAQLLTFMQRQQEREDQQRQDMLQIQQQIMSMFQAFSTAYTQQIAEERESRRLKEEMEQC